MANKGCQSSKSRLSSTRNQFTTMSKKHFVAAANIIQSEPCLEKRGNLARFFCELAKKDNPRFDELRFLTACGIS